MMAVALLTMNAMKARGELRRRAIDVHRPAGADKRDLRAGSMHRTQRLLASVGKHYAESDPHTTKVLRSRLSQAGLYEPYWVSLFLGGRIVLAAVLGLACYLLLPGFRPNITPMNVAMISALTAGVGYALPNILLSNRIKACATEHRSGFPDFMDLMVVCADAGLAIEAALDRVGRELAESYPSLAGNLHMATLEIRAGRTLAEALEHLGDRLAIDEARTFATLIQQSEELGSSVTEALRVYSDEMRHKRLSRAEEKAYALPAKLVIPLGVFIFPILFVVILLPAAMRVMYL
jgi:tight adherence protein C